MPKRKHEQQLRKRFTLLLETAEALLRAIETFKANDMAKDEAIYQEAKKYTSEKLLEIHDLDKLNEFIKEREQFYKKHQEQLDQIKRDVEALEEAESNFYDSALDLNKYKKDIKSESDFEENDKKIKKELQDFIDKMQIEIVNSRYKNKHSLQTQAMPLDGDWATKDKQEKNWTRQRELLKQGLSKAYTFIGSLAESQNAEKLRSKPEYFALRKQYDFFKDFFAVDAQVIERKNFVKELQQRRNERIIDEQYAEEEFTRALTPELIEVMNRQVEDEAAVIKGQQSAQDTSILFGRKNVKDKEKSESNEKKYDPTLQQMIFAHNNIRRNIDIMNGEIIRVNEIISELITRIVKWQYPPLKFSNAPEEDNKAVIKKLEAKKEELNTYVRILLEHKKQYSKEYIELTPSVAAKIIEYLSSDEALLPESKHFQLKQEEFNDIVKRFTSTKLGMDGLTAKFNLVLRLERINQDLFQDFYGRLESNAALRDIAEWKERNPGVEISSEMDAEISRSIQQLQDNQGSLYTYTQFLMSEIEGKLIDGINAKLDVRDIAHLSELRQNLIDFIAKDLMKWNEYLYARTQEKNLSVEESKSRLTEYTLASNNLSHYVMQDILTKVNIHSRTLVMERWISMMNASLKIGDYHTAAAIRDALNNPALNTLHKTWMGISSSDRNKLAEPIHAPDSLAQMANNDVESVAKNISLKLDDINYATFLTDEDSFLASLEEIKLDLAKLIILYVNNHETQRQLKLFLDALNKLEYDLTLDDNLKSSLHLIRDIIPDIQVQSENRMSVLGKASTLQTKIMQVNPDHTTGLAEKAKGYEDIKSEESKHEKSKPEKSKNEKSRPEKSMQSARIHVQETVQPSTIVALIASKAQEGKLLNDPATRVNAILNPVIRELVIARKYEANDAFIRAVNAAAINPDRSKSIKKILKKYKFPINEDQVSTIEGHNKQIYYHSLIENPILGELLKNTYLKSIDPKYKKTRLLIHKINRTILFPTDDASLKLLLNNIGFESIKDSQIQAIQAENARLHRIIENIAADNAGLSTTQVREKSLQWLETNRNSHITPSTLYTLSTLPTIDSKNKKEPSRKHELLPDDADEIAKDLLQTFMVLDELLSKIESHLDKLIDEKTAANNAKLGRGMFGLYNEKNRRILPSNEKKLEKNPPHPGLFKTPNVSRPGPGQHSKISPSQRKSTSEKKD